MPDQIETYVETAMDQVRWKKARPGLAAEIRTHLLDQRDACLAQGMDEGAAQGEAVRQMGDPVALGTDLDRVHRPRPQWGLLVFALALAMLGTLLRMRLSANLKFISNDDLMLDLAGGVLGAVCLAAGYLLDISALGRRAGWVCMGFLAIVVFLLLSWDLRVQGVSWQVEFFLYLFPLTLALLLWRLRGRGWPGVLGGLVWTGLAVFQCIILFNGSALFYVTISALVLGLFFACQDWFGIGKKLGTVLVTVLGLGILFLIVYYGYWTQFRFDIHPELDPLNRGYYAATIRTALSGAKWLGPVDPALWFTENGWSLVPNIEGDNLLTNLICSWGWLPFLAVVGAFAALFLWMLWKTIRLRQTLGRAVCLGGLTALGVQAVFSLLLNLGVPLFAASFPLVVGNTGTVLNMFFIGLMLSAFRDGAMPEERPAERLLTVPAVSWIDGVLTVNFKGRTLSE